MIKTEDFNNSLQFVNISQLFINGKLQKKHLCLHHFDLQHVKTYKIRIFQI